MEEYDICIHGYPVVSCPICLGIAMDRPTFNGRGLNPAEIGIPYPDLGDVLPPFKEDGMLKSRHYIDGIIEEWKRRIGGIERRGLPAQYSVDLKRRRDGNINMPYSYNPEITPVDIGAKFTDMMKKKTYSRKKP